MMPVCIRCGSPAEWSRKGWVHENGGIYVQRCRSCGKVFSSYDPIFTCPECHSRDVVDDHCILVGYIEAQEASA